MSGWGCPHERDGTCRHLKGKPCDPGQAGCVLAGRFAFANPAKNRPPRRKPKPKTKTKTQSNP